MSYETSTVVITGGNRGIGRKIALAFAHQTNHSLFLIARNSDTLRSVRAECIAAGAPAVETAACDLTSPESIESLQFPSALPDPAILINNAGTFLLKPLQETGIGDFREQWEVNALGPFALVQRFLPQLKQNSRGLIANISSVGALKGQARSGAYSSGKHALLGFTRSLRLELRSTGIAVTAVNLGQTMSTSWEGTDVDPEELIDPADVGNLLVFLAGLSPRTVVEELTIRPQRGDRAPD